MTRPTEPKAKSNYSESVAKSVLSESAVYGVLAVSALIIVTGSSGDEASWDIFLKVAGTVLVFFVAHVFASVVSHLGVAINGDKSFGRLVLYGLGHGSGLLIASLIPLGIILLGATGAVSDNTAVWTALWVDVALLGLIGFAAVARMTTNRRDRAIGAALTTLLGLVIMVFKVLIH